MARKVIIPAVAQQEYDEEILSFCYVAERECVAVEICKGTIVDGKFVFDKSSLIETVTILGDDFATLMTKFKKDDLWSFVDGARAKKNGGV